jgi:hypothetical protein
VSLNAFLIVIAEFQQVIWQFEKKFAYRGLARVFHRIKFTDYMGLPAGAAQAIGAEIALSSLITVGI